ncbi:proline dehydrogenase family protein [Evansella clarkii]|uniref:proline dehydrogenase family protein n=1 Tax=Evansella clarkii TaxID=79879 RepID=UPI000B449FBD|nr:proline dehydrogenase family protein [Evansella clarkii]
MLIKNFFLNLSQNQLLIKMAENYGLALGAKNVVGGTTVTEMVEHVKALNEAGLTATVDRLGEFVTERDVAIRFKSEILEVIEAIHTNKLNAHISLKPTQLGLGIDKDFCLENLKEIVSAAENHNIFINMDMEDYPNIETTYELLGQLKKEHNNVGTVIQAYLYRAEKDVFKHEGTRMRIVKGAYKEPEDVALQDKKEIDRNFRRLIEHHLLHGEFTSIATHDHHVINDTLQFVEKHNIPKEKYEFQMLYGFRRDYQLKLVQEGHAVCTYVPFGTDWYGYFMRRLAERPQNINLVLKQAFNRKTKIALGAAGGAVLLSQLVKKRSS